jgi:hypothetical protein
MSVNPLSLYLQFTVAQLFLLVRGSYRRIETKIFSIHFIRHRVNRGFENK